MSHTKLIPAILAVSAAGLLPLCAQQPDARSDARTEASGSSSGSSSSFSESKSRRIVIIDGKRVVDETKHTRNGEDVSRDKEDSDPAGDSNTSEGPWLGLSVEEASSVLRSQLELKENEGLAITDVVEAGPADKAGLRVNDILLKFAGTPLGTPGDLRDALDQHQIGETVILEYLRNGGSTVATVTLEKRPENQRDDGNQAGDREQSGETNQQAREGRNPDGAGAGLKIDELERLVEKLQANQGNHSFKMEVNGGNFGNLDELLENPDLPDDFKRKVREMMDRMRDLEEHRARD